MVLGQRLGLDVSGISFFFCGFGAASVVMQLGVVGRVTDAIGDRRSSLLGFAVTMISFALVPITHNMLIGALMITSLLDSGSR